MSINLEALPTEVDRSGYRWICGPAKTQPNTDLSGAVICCVYGQFCKAEPDAEGMTHVQNWAKAFPPDQADAEIEKLNAMFPKHPAHSVNFRSGTIKLESP